MALTLACENANVVGIDELIDYVETHVQLDDLDSVASAAPMFKGLANDRELVIKRLNAQVKNLFRNEAAASAQVLFLGEGKGFYLRANIWPSTADISSGRVYQDQFSYNVAHDHNYNFMTVGYHGPGYDTEIYEYDNSKLEGYVGEKVDFEFLERTHFSTGMVMLYRASKDMHIQYPPDDLSISLNLMVFSPEVRVRDQYFFDLQTRTLVEYPPDLDGSRRVSMLKMVAHVGNADTAQLLDDLAISHPCRRTRLTAFEAQAQLLPDDAARVWTNASRDREKLVVNAARRKLAELEG